MLNAMDLAQQQHDRDILMQHELDLDAQHDQEIPPALEMHSE